MKKFNRSLALDLATMTEEMQRQHDAEMAQEAELEALRPALLRRGDAALPVSNRRPAPTKRAR